MTNLEAALLVTMARALGQVAPDSYETRLLEVAHLVAMDHNLAAEPLLRKLPPTTKWMVALGNAFDGLVFYGPFDSPQEANDYADDTHGNQSWEVVTLEVRDPDWKPRLEDVV